MSDIKKIIPVIRENVSLADYTSFKIGGPAKYFFTARTKEDIIRAVKAAQQLNLPFFILAGGSNVLFSDKGFNGLVIKLQTTNYQLQTNKLIYAEAGVGLSQVMNLAADNSLTGLEWAAGIPWATLGGAIRGNAGGFGRTMANIVKSVEVLDTTNYEIPEGRTFGVYNFKLEDCQFEYRQSIFKKDKNLIILSANIQLQKGDKEKIKEEMAKNLKYRKEHHPLDYPSAGSVFENIAFKDLNKEFFEKYPEAKKFFSLKMMPAGFIIEKAGLKGKTIGQAKVSAKHANFIVNLGGATARDVLDLIALIKRQVKDKFKIELKEEIIIANQI